MGISGNSKKGPEFELSAEVVRAAFLVRDWASHAIASGVTSRTFPPAEIIRLCKAVDALRVHRGTASRLKRQRRPWTNPNHG